MNISQRDGEYLYNVLSAAGANGMNDRFVHHDLVIDDDMTYGTGNHQLYGFSGQDAILSIYDGVSAGSRQFKFTQGGDILTRNRRDWVTWNAWTSITPKVSVFFYGDSANDPWYPNQGASGLVFYDPNGGYKIEIAFPSGGGTQMAIRNNNSSWRIL